MATYTVGPSGDYATLALAMAGVGTGNTIQILTAYVHDGTTLSVTKSGVAYESESGNPADCVVEVSHPSGWMFSSTRTGLSFSGITFKQTAASGTRYSLYVNRSQAVFSDCVIECVGDTGTAYGAIYPGTNATFRRCVFEGGDASTGVRQALPYDFVLESCLFKNWGDYSVNVTNGNVTAKNCTFYMPNGFASTVRVFYANVSNTSIYNCVVYGGTGDDGVDVGVELKRVASNNAKNVISFGGQATDFDVGVATTANLYDQADVTADGNPVFVNIGTDFRPDPSGLAYQNGDTNFAPTKDLAGNDFNDPPSIGCYEGESSGGGGGGGAVMKSRAGLLPSPFTLNP